MPFNSCLQNSQSGLKNIIAVFLPDPVSESWNSCPSMVTRVISGRFLMFPISALCFFSAKKNKAPKAIATAQIAYRMICLAFI